MPACPASGRYASSMPGESWLPAMAITCAPVPARASSALIRMPLRIGAGRRGVVQVAGDQHGVDLMLLGDADDLGQDGFLLVKAAAALKGLADVPVGGVQELHNDPPGVGCCSCSSRCLTRGVSLIGVADGISTGARRRRWRTGLATASAPAAPRLRSTRPPRLRETRRGRLRLRGLPTRGTGSRPRAGPGSPAGR